MLPHTSLPAVTLSFAYLAVFDAHAQQSDAAAVPDFTLSAEIAVVSDYRFRGWSLSGEDPAVQADLGVAHASGAYVGVFVSTIEPNDAAFDGEGATVEVDLYTGWGFEIAGWQADVSVIAYAYPGENDADYYVLPVMLTRAFGDATLTAGYEYTPAQDALAGESGSYAWLEGSLALQAMPLTIRGSIGYEDGAWAPEGKTDWMLAASVPLDVFEVGLAFVDSDEVAAGSALVGELRADF